MSRKPRRIGLNRATPELRRQRDKLFGLMLKNLGDERIEVRRREPRLAEPADERVQVADGKVRGELRWEIDPLVGRNMRNIRILGSFRAVRDAGGEGKAPRRDWHDGSLGLDFDPLGPCGARLSLVDKLHFAAPALLI